MSFVGPIVIGNGLAVIGRGSSSDGLLFQDFDVYKHGNGQGIITLGSESNLIQYPIIINKVEIQDKDKISIVSCFAQEHIYSFGNSLTNINLSGLIFTNLITPNSIIGNFISQIKGSLSATAVGLNGQEANLSIGTFGYSGIIHSFSIALSAESNCYIIFSLSFLGQDSLQNKNNKKNAMNVKKA